MRPVSAAPGEIAASRRRAGGGGGTPTVLGYDTKGSGTFAFGANRCLVSQFTLASAGTLTELHGWFNGSGPSARIVIYDDDGGSGLPGTRLAYTPGTTLAGGDTEISQSGLSVALAAGNYWIGVHTSATGASWYGESTGTTHQQRTSVSYGSPPPDPFGTPGSSGTFKISVWAVVLV